MKSFHGCTAFITGASAGIGREIARQLAPSAAHLIIVARRNDRLEELKAELNAAHPGLTVHCYKVDLTDPVQIEALLRWLDESGLDVNLLVNNAGVGDHSEFENGDWARIKRMIDLNILALTRITHHILPGMRRLPEAAILNVSSVAGLLPVPTMAVYAASKAYVCSFTEALRSELFRTAVTVTALCPGPVDTEFNAAAELPGASPKGDSPAILKVRAEDVARIALAAVARDRPRVIPGLAIAALVTAAGLVPLFFLRFFLNRYREFR